MTTVLSQAGLISATTTFLWRATRKIKNDPSPLLMDAAFAVVFMLIFTYLFGGALGGSTDNYLQFLLPGILLMAIIPMTAASGGALSADISKGVFNRFRTLPFWQPAAIIGLLLSDILRYVVAVGVTFGIGILIGYRPEGGVVGALGGLMLVILFAFAVSWIFAVFGVVAKKPESVASTSMVVIYPLLFASNVFVDSDTMPSWLQVVIQLNPVSHIATATRGLMGGVVTSSQIIVALISCVVILGIFSSITFVLYRRKGLA